MATLKLMTDSCEFTGFSTNAEARVRYYVDMASGGTASPEILKQATALVPPIGSIKDFSNIPGAPMYGVRNTHQMRVYSTHPTLPSVNAKKLYIDVVYKSRPTPSVESGSSGIQTKTETYLADKDGTRKQMAIDWSVPKGTWGTGPDGAQQPANDTPLPKAPASGTRFQFGSTVRLSATYYADEISEAQLYLLQSIYTTTVNFSIFTTSFPFNDSRMWLCSSVGFNSVDHFEFRVSAEWIFNPYGWDTIAVYNSSMFGQAIIADAALAKIYAGTNSSTPVPTPIADKNQGIGRFPQSIGINASNLASLLYQHPSSSLNLLVSQALAIRGIAYNKRDNPA